FTECLRRHTESAVCKISAWKEGEFVFEQAAPPAFASSLQLRVDDLLLEGARRADEWGLIQQKIPRFDIVFERVIGSAEGLTKRGIGEADLKVFSYIDGKRTVQEIIDILRSDDFAAAKSLFILLSVNLIRRRR